MTGDAYKNVLISCNVLIVECWASRSTTEGSIITVKLSVLFANFIILLLTFDDSKFSQCPYLDIFFNYFSFFKISSSTLWHFCINFRIYSYFFLVFYPSSFIFFNNSVFVKLKHEICISISLILLLKTSYLFYNYFYNFSYSRLSSQYYFECRTYLYNYML